MRAQIAIWGKLDTEQPLVHSFIAIILNRARPCTFILKIYCVYCNKATYAHLKTKQNKTEALGSSPQPMADGNWSKMSELPGPLERKLWGMNSILSPRLSPHDWDLGNQCSWLKSSSFIGCLPSQSHFSYASQRKDLYLLFCLTCF